MSDWGVYMRTIVYSLGNHFPFFQILTSPQRLNTSAVRIDTPQQLHISVMSTKKVYSLVGPPEESNIVPTTALGIVPSSHACFPSLNTFANPAPQGLQTILQSLFLC